jgi:hypothetical protein
MTINVRMTGLPDGKWQNLSEISVPHKAVFYNGFMSKYDGQECTIIKIRDDSRCVIEFSDGREFLAYNTEIWVTQ